MSGFLALAAYGRGPNIRYAPMQFIAKYRGGSRKIHLRIVFGDRFQKSHNSEQSFRDSHTAPLIRQQMNPAPKMENENCLLRTVRTRGCLNLFVTLIFMIACLMSLASHRSGYRRRISCFYSRLQSPTLTHSLALTSRP